MATVDHMLGDLGMAQVGEQVDREPHKPELVQVSEATADPAHEDIPP